MNFFTSRRNLVGLVLAAIALVSHLLFGLGILWPIVVIAAWGLGVVITPNPVPQPPMEAQSPGPQSLKDAAWSSINHFLDLGVEGSTQQILQDLLRTMGALDSHRRDMAEQPILINTANEIALQHLPEVERAYAEVPRYLRPQAKRQLESALQLLNQESQRILSSIATQKFKDLEEKRRMLNDEFVGLQLYLKDDGETKQLGTTPSSNVPTSGPDWDNFGQHDSPPASMNPGTDRDPVNPFEGKPEFPQAPLRKFGTGGDSENPYGFGQ